MSKFTQILNNQTHKLKNLMKNHTASYLIRCAVCRRKKVQITTSKIQATMTKMGWKAVTYPTTWACPECAKTMEKQANSVGYTSIFEEI